MPLSGSLLEKQMWGPTLGLLNQTPWRWHQGTGVQHASQVVLALIRCWEVLQRIQWREIVES